MVRMYSRRKSVVVSLCDTSTVKNAGFGFPNASKSRHGKLSKCPSCFGAGHWRLLLSFRQSAAAPPFCTNNYLDT